MRRSALGWASAALAALVSCTGKRPKHATFDPEPAPVVERMRAAVYRDPQLAYAVPYRLYVPEVKPGERYPLLLYLHGGGARGDDNVRQVGGDLQYALARSVRALVGPFFVLAPQCPAHDQWIERRDSPPFRNYQQARFPESDAAKSTFAIVEGLLAAEPIDADRVYVTGPSMGGSGTWDFITRHPGVFAAAVPVTGVSDPSRAAAIADLPIWAFHGTRDDVSPIENLREMRRALQAAGSTKARFTELEGVGHASWEHAYSQLELYRWLFQQRRAPAPRP